MKKKEPEPRLDEMTLRDLMAMFAMMGQIAHHGYVPKNASMGAAKEAYAQADAMIEERKPKMKNEDQTPIRKDMDAPGMY